jgi:NAD(P)-dependent dehydrogenase (short-subunit alcohol dehydrogenase family)
MTPRTLAAAEDAAPPLANERRVALVTGGTRGIGLGIAQALARDGWDLAVNGMRATEEVAAPLASLNALGVRAIYCRGDVSSADDRERIVDEVRRQFGRLHLLVNNAGITSPGRRDLLDATEEAFDLVLAVNWKGPLLLTQACVAFMRAQERADPRFAGAVVNISSVSAEIVSTNRGDYCLSRAAVSASGLQWARALKGTRIRVFEVRPGIIRTDMTAGVTEKYDRLIAGGLTADRRWGEPSDVGTAVALLAAADSPYATGSLLLVDGGLTRLRSL